MNKILEDTLSGPVEMYLLYRKYNANKYFWGDL